MKQVFEEKITKTQVPMWEATDGTRFTTEEACMRYDQSCLCTLRTKFKNLPKIKTVPIEQLALDSNDRNAYLVKITSDQDLIVISNLLCYHICSDLSDKTYKKLVEIKDSNKIAIILETTDRDSMWLEGCLDEYVDSLKSMIKNFDKLGEEEVK